MDKNSIHELIDRWLIGACTQEEKELINQYFLLYGLQEKQLMDDASNYPSKEQSDRMLSSLSAQLNLAASSKKRHTFHISRWLRVAAVFIPFLLIVTVLFFQNKGTRKNNSIASTSLKQIINNGDGLKQVTLTDGSIIILNKNASISLDTLAFGQYRHLSLMGEAYFEVTHDAQRPFTVAAKGLITKVLGTTFNINSGAAGADKTTVTLFTGSVSLSAKGNGGQLLKPDQAAVFDSSSGYLKIAPASPYARAWKTKEIVCRNELFQDIIDYLEAYYGIPIIASKPIAEKRFSGSLSLHGNISSVLDRLLFVHQLNHKINNGKGIVIF